LTRAWESDPAGWAMKLGRCSMLWSASCAFPRRGLRSVRRTSLIDRLMREVSRPIVSVVAPAGYGKTTLLVQWAERSGQAVAWVSVDEQDNDSKGLLGAVARALDAVRPVARPVFDALASPASSVPCSVMPRLGNAFAAMTVPVPVILDDMHVLHSSECRAWPRSSESSASPAAARWHGACGRQGSIRQRDRRLPRACSRPDLGDA
jgi:hypothetical protein